MYVTTTQNKNQSAKRQKETTKGSGKTAQSCLESTANNAAILQGRQRTNLANRKVFLLSMAFSLIKYPHLMWFGQNYGFRLIKNTWCYWLAHLQTRLSHSESRAICKSQSFQSQQSKSIKHIEKSIEISDITLNFTVAHIYKFCIPILHLLSLNERLRSKTNK